MENYKKCTSCNEEKTLDNFYPSKTKRVKDGLSYECRACNKRKYFERKSPIKPVESLDGEFWIQVPEYPVYFVSNACRIKREESNTLRAGGKTFLKRPMLLKPQINIHGYEKVFLVQDKEKRQFLVHRLMASLFIPNPYNKPFVNHIDGNKLNNSILNLEWCTAKENTKHAWDNNLCTAHGRGGNRILSADDVEDIKSMRLSGVQIKDICKKYNVHRHTVSKIVNGKTYTK